MAVIAVSAGGATVVIGLVIVLVLLTALLMKVKSKRNGENTNRTGKMNNMWLLSNLSLYIYPSSSKDGCSDVPYAVHYHTSTEVESEPIYESIVSVTTEIAFKVCTIQDDNDLDTVTCRAYDYIPRR